MLVDGKYYRSIWLDENDPRIIRVIDQRVLPHEFTILDVKTFEEMLSAIGNMTIRGAGLIGAAAGYAMYLAALEAEDKHFYPAILSAAARLKQTRPTAVNLAFAVERQLAAMTLLTDPAAKRQAAYQMALAIAQEDEAAGKAIGEYGRVLIEDIAKKKNGPVNILTHCNAGWLAFVDHGTALSPIYNAHNAGIDVHVWVDETRPRNQGASLTAWELGKAGVPHTLICDNTGGHLMQNGNVDMVITGADRVSANGDAANKIGTYLKALAARDNDIPFYVALPTSTFDLSISNGIGEIEIEQRDATEVQFVKGKTKEGQVESVLICPEETPVANYGFDVTPARLITKLITEKGICDADNQSILRLLKGK